MNTTGGERTCVGAAWRSLQFFKPKIHPAKRVSKAGLIACDELIITARHNAVANPMVQHETVVAAVVVHLTRTPT